MQITQWKACFSLLWNAQDGTMVSLPVGRKHDIILCLIGIQVHERENTS
jgi:hypothetical protein